MRLTPGIVGALGGSAAGADVAGDHGLIPGLLVHHHLVLIHGVVVDHLRHRLALGPGAGEPEEEEEEELEEEEEDEEELEEPEPELAAASAMCCLQASSVPNTLPQPVHL